MKLAFACPYYGSTHPSVGYAQRRLIWQSPASVEWVDDYSSVGMQHREACESMARRGAEDARIDAVFWTEHDVMPPEGTIKALVDAAERFPDVDIFAGIVFRRCLPYSPMVSTLEPISRQKYEQMKTSPVSQKRRLAKDLSYEELAAANYVAITKLDTTADPYPVDTASMGCLLIRRRALQAVIDIRTLFEARLHVSIDNVFFQHCASRGLKLYCVPSVLCDHLGDNERIGAEKWMETVREAQRAIAQKMVELTSTGDPVLAAFARTSVRGLPMIQHAVEIQDAARWLLSRAPLKRVLEIGTHHGGTASFWAELGAEVVAVDLPGGEFGGIGEEAARERDHQLDSLYADRYTPVWGDSHDAETVKTVAAIYDGRALHNGRGVDLLFIDGDHSLAGVTADYENYRCFVRPGGVVLFHDIVATETHAKAGCEVPILWRALKETPGAEWREFVCGEQWGGLGALVAEG